MPRKPRLLDLFCGAGGSAVGYARAGFEVVGVDIRPQPHYPFEFHQGDALEFLAAHGGGFDVVHASPPCQRYARNQNQHVGHWRHPALIGPTRDAIPQGMPYVIENVVVARFQMENPVMLCGEKLGLGVQRHRLFESNVPLKVAKHTPHRGRVGDGRFVTVAGKPGGSSRRTGAKYGNTAAWQEAMGIDWMSSREITQAIPPAYTEFIGRQLI